MINQNKIISIVLPNLNGGGTERVAIELAREFVKYDYEVEFVLMEITGDFLNEARKDFKVFDLKTSHLRYVPIH